MTQELSVTEKRRKAVFYVTNESDRPIAVQANITTREMDDQGREKNLDVDETFILFPDQLIIKPKEKRAIKVTYTGKNLPKVEKAYRFIAEQLPIDVDDEAKKKKKTNIRILLKYRAAFYLTPKDVRSEVLKEKKTYRSDGKKMKILLTNIGDKHEILKDYHLYFESGKLKKKYSLSLFKSIYGENLLAKAKRFFEIEVPKEFKSFKKITVGIEK